MIKVTNKYQLIHLGIASTNPSGTVPHVPQFELIFDRVFERALCSFDCISPEDRLKDNTQRYIDPVREAGLVDISEALSGWLENGRLMRRSGMGQEEVAELYAGFVEYINGGLDDGKISNSAAKIFLYALNCFADLGVHYDAILENPRKSSSAERAEYVQATLRLWNAYSKEHKVSDQNAFGFNPIPRGKEIVSRVYISADLTASPSKIVNEWHAALKKTVNDLSVHFKVNKWLSEKYHTVVIYVGDGENEALRVEDSLRTFLDNCDPKLLSETAMPTAIPLQRGISIAPEPIQVNKFVPLLAGRKISYSKLIAVLFELAFTLAFDDMRQNERQPLIITSESLRESAKKYFRQLIFSSGINPDTMSSAR